MHLTDQLEIDFVPPRIVHRDANPAPAFGHCLLGHHGQGRHSDEGNIERDAQSAHECETDALAGEGARAGGDGKTIKAGNSQAASCMAISTIGASASAWPRSIAVRRCAEHLVIIENCDGTGAERGVDGQNSHSRSDNLAGFVEGEARIAWRKAQPYRHGRRCR